MQKRVNSEGFNAKQWMAAMAPYKGNARAGRREPGVGSLWFMWREGLTTSQARERIEREYPDFRARAKRRISNARLLAMIRAAILQTLASVEFDMLDAEARATLNATRAQLAKS